MPTVMITGANRGIGLELTRQYAADGWTIIATCRNPISPGELATLEGDIQVHGLDVTNHPQVESLARDLKGTAIDLLINNAGIYGPRGLPHDEMDYGAWEEVLRTNTLAPLKVASCFLENVAASEQKKLVTISSQMASITNHTTGGEYIYRSTKAAVNMVMRCFAGDVADRGLTVAVFHPGWVQTDMGGPGAAIDVVTSVNGLRPAFAKLTTADNGSFFNYDGTPLPW